MKAANEFADIEELITTEPEAVAYTREAGGYHLYTISTDASRKLARSNIRMVYNPRAKRYEGFAKKLPRIKSVTIYKHEVKAPPRRNQAQIERRYRRLSKMYEVMDKMMGEIGKAEEELIELIKEHGLKLKPGSKFDSQLLCRDVDTRLHYRHSMHKRVDRERLLELTKKYPRLKKCVSYRKVPQIDNGRLHEILMTLPTSVTNEIISLTTNYSFRTDELQSPGCSYCGGKIRKDGICKHCGLKEE